MSKLVPPHGGKGLVIRLMEGAAKEAELKKAAGLKKVQITAQEKGDLIMIGIGGFSPLQMPAGLDYWRLFHGVDERVPIDGLRFGVRVLERFLRAC